MSAKFENITLQLKTYLNQDYKEEDTEGEVKVEEYEDINVYKILRISFCLLWCYMTASKCSVYEISVPYAMLRGQ